MKSTRSLPTASTLVLTACLSISSAMAHYVPDAEYAVTNSTPLPFVIESKGPVRAPKAMVNTAGLRVSGQGFWKFTAARDRVPVPAAVPSVVQAHGTIIVDKATDTVYWGLQGVGWIGFSNKLQNSWIVQGNPEFTNGNLHGADILPRSRKSPLIAAADNMSGKVYLTDTGFQNVETLERPTFGTYATNKAFAPTDVAFADAKELWVVDGYAQQRFMAANVSPFAWQGEHYGSGKRFSSTLHGVTYDKAHHDLLFSARPEGQLKRVDRKPRRALDIMGLPAGTLLCDIDLWGDYALAACLDGPNKTPGPLHIINLKKRAIVSTIKPKEDLGYTDAKHLHDAAWYVTGKGKEQEVYLLFTNWNPGGIGALKLVNIAD
jgi:hypothetical protein